MCAEINQLIISIHAPHTGSDPCGDRGKVFSISFQSTLPIRGATELHSTLYLPSSFQSTLPIRGATLLSDDSPDLREDFNPRSPYGERRGLGLKPYVEIKFQSTLPIRGATGSRAVPMSPALFQSTLPIRGATCIRRSY